METLNGLALILGPVLLGLLAWALNEIYTGLKASIDQTKRELGADIRFLRESNKKLQETSSDLLKLVQKSSTNSIEQISRISERVVKLQQDVEILKDSVSDLRKSDVFSEKFGRVVKVLMDKVK